MFIELSEALVCPACGPPQGLVVVVDGLDGRRVTDGFLGCPICEARFPIQSGVVNLTHPARSAPETDPPAPERADTAAPSPPELQPDLQAEEAAEIIAALFDIRDGNGYVLLDEILGPVAASVAELTGGCEVIALSDSGADSGADSRADPGAPGTNYVAGAGPSLPVQNGRLRALALGRPTDARLRDAIRVLAPEGRLVVMRPTANTRALLRELPVRPLADEPMAFLGVVAPTA